MRSATQKIYGPERSEPGIVLVRWSQIYLTNEQSNVVNLDRTKAHYPPTPIDSIRHRRLDALFKMSAEFSRNHSPILPSTFIKILWNEPPLAAGSGIRPQYFNAALEHCVNFHLLTKLLRFYELWLALQLKDGARFPVVEELIETLKSGNQGVFIESSIFAASIKSEDGKVFSTKEFIAALVICLSLLSDYGDIKSNAVEILNDIKWVISEFAKLSSFDDFSIDLGENDEDIPAEIVALIERRRRDGPSSMFAGHQSLLDKTLFEPNGKTRF